MKLPNKLFIGYQDIEVIETDFPDNEQGVYISDKSEIRIQQGLDKRENLNTLIHECFHAIVHVYGIKGDFKEEEEERLVNIFANGFTEIFSRNPEFVKWISYHAGK